MIIDERIAEKKIPPYRIDTLSWLIEFKSNNVCTFSFFLLSSRRKKFTDKFCGKNTKYFGVKSNVLAVSSLKRYVQIMIIEHHVVSCTGYFFVLFFRSICLSNLTWYHPFILLIELRISDKDIFVHTYTFTFIYSNATIYWSLQRMIRTYLSSSLRGCLLSNGSFANLVSFSFYTYKDQSKYDD